MKPNTEKTVINRQISSLNMNNMTITPPNSPRKPRYFGNRSLNRKRKHDDSSLSLIIKRIKFENIVLPPCKNPVYFPKDKNCYIEEMPSEILGMIFKNITNFKQLLYISMVSKRWKQLSSAFNNPSFICEQFSSRMRKNMRNFQLDAITQQFPRMRKVSLLNCHSIHHEGFKSIADNCHNLEVLKFNTIGYIPSSIMDTIIKKCPLRHLELKGNIELWESDNLPTFNLTKLVISDNNKFFDTSIKILSEKCHQLETLVIHRCLNFNLDNNNIDDIQNLTNFVRNNKSLKHLTLARINITNQVLEGIAECEQLEGLKIDNCFLVSNGGIRNLVGKLPNLKHITISNTDTTYAAFNLLTDAIMFPKLEEIVFNNNNRQLMINADQIYINDLIFAIHQARKKKNEKEISMTRQILNDDKSNHIEKYGGKLKLKVISLEEAFNPYEQQYYHKNHTQNPKIRSFLQKIDLRIVF